MGVLLTYMFSALMVLVGLTFAQEYDSDTKRDINLLKWRMDNVNKELLDVKADLKVEKTKTMKLEKQVNTLMEGNKMTKIDDTDSDLPGHESVIDHQQAIDKVFSSIEQRVYQAMNDEKIVRKQFQNQTQTDFKTEKENMDIKFTALNATLSAVIETKLETIENKVRDSITVLNESISSIENLSMHVQHNDGDIISLRVESDQLNTTLLEQGAILSTLNDSLVVVQASIIALENDSHHYKENNNRIVQQNNEAINRLLEQSQHGNTTLLGHDAALTSLNTLVVDLNAYVSVLYREHTDNTDYADCYDIHKQTGSPTGLYLVKPHGLNRKVLVMCDMDTDGGGWTVFQYRHDGSVDFYRNFTDYENGFGSVKSEFWLGLSYIQVMASTAPTQLRIDVEAADGTKGFETYDKFYLTTGPDYALNVETSSGTIVGIYEDLEHNNGESFSTHDHDRDGYSGNCAELRHGGWWYYECTNVNLNGQYLTQGTTSSAGMYYYNFKKYESLKSSKLMFRKK